MLSCFSNSRKNSFVLVIKLISIIFLISKEGLVVSTPHEDLLLVQPYIGSTFSKDFIKDGGFE